MIDDDSGVTSSSKLLRSCTVLVREVLQLATVELAQLIATRVNTLSRWRRQLLLASHQAGTEAQTSRDGAQITRGAVRGVYFIVFLDLHMKSRLSTSVLFLMYRCHGVRWYIGAVVYTVDHDSTGGVAHISSFLDVVKLVVVRHMWRTLRCSWREIARSVDECDPSGGRRRRCHVGSGR